MSNVNEMKKIMESVTEVTEATETTYDVEVYPPYEIALVRDDRVVAKIDINEWKILNRKVAKALRNSK